MNKMPGTAIIGLGYVGLPLTIAFAKAGFKVTGFDNDPDKISRLMNGESYLKHINNHEIEALIEKEFTATTDFSLLEEQDLIAICVPTPLDRYKQPDLQYVVRTTETIARYLRKGQTIVLESTTYPGTTREVVLPILENTGLKVGEDFFLAYSPEREDPGRTDYCGSNMPRVIGGITPKCLEKACSYYDKAIVKMHRVASPEVAEMGKLLENIYRSVNIALVNELKIIADKMGINIWEVIEAASTKPFGFQPFYPGPGLGGHCLPIDPFYLSYKAREYDLVPRFIELAGEINTRMPYWVVRKTADAMNEQEKCLKNSRILLIGIAYKRDIDDMRESPAMKIWEILLEKSAVVDYHDPYIPKVPQLRDYDIRGFSIELTAENVQKYDAVIIVTDHSNVNYEVIVQNASLIIDTRNTIQSKGKNKKEN